MASPTSSWAGGLSCWATAVALFKPPKTISSVARSSRQSATSMAMAFRISPKAAVGRRYADKLFKVWLKDGQEAWILIHVEVQSQHDDEFPERMFVYHYRLYDRYRRPVVSLAVLGDELANWRPNRFGYSLCGCTMGLEFPVVKLLDHGADLAALEASTNPFAPLVLAHLQTLATRQDPAARHEW